MACVDCCRRPPIGNPFRASSLYTSNGAASILHAVLEAQSMTKQLQRPVSGSINQILK